MIQIKKKYVTDENKHPVAVQIDIKTYEKIEQVLEDYALAKYIEENDPDEAVTLNEAKEIYKNL